MTGVSVPKDSFFFGFLYHAPHLYARRLSSGSPGDSKDPLESLLLAPSHALSSPAGDIWFCKQDAEDLAPNLGSHFRPNLMGWRRENALGVQRR